MGPICLRNGYDQRVAVPHYSRMCKAGGTVRNFENLIELSSSWWQNESPLAEERHIAAQRTDDVLLYGALFFGSHEILHQAIMAEGMTTAQPPLRDIGVLQTLVTHRALICRGLLATVFARHGFRLRQIFPVMDLESQRSVLLPNVSSARII